jgi:hypothetical protein
MKTVALVGSIAACLTLSACVAFIGPRGATDRSKQIRGAFSGQKQRIGAFYSTNPDCSSAGYPSLKVVKAPQHGAVSVEQGSTEAAFDKNNARSACNGKEIPATLVYYTSTAGFVGRDTVEMERIGVQGGYGYHVYTINVR